MNNNKRFILNIMSDAVMIFAVSLIPSVAVSVICDEDAVTQSMPLIMLSYLFLGAAGRRYSGRISAQVRPRIWYMTTFFTWLLIIMLTVPLFCFGMPQYSFIDAVMESCAGWTTTGIGVYDTVALPHSLQLCRSTCNWLGGIGIIMAVLAFVPARQYVGWGLASTEFPGPSFMKSVSEFRQGYRKVVLVYIILTMLQFIMLALCGMPVFTAILTSMSGISTAGMQHIDNGVISGLPYVIKLIITLFTFIGSVNFTLILLIAGGKTRALKKDSEIKVHMGRLIFTVLFICGFVTASGHGAGIAKVFSDVTMQVISFASTSGYIVTDYTSWPQVCIIFMLLQMFMGACAVSTAGGIKTSRMIIAIKTVTSGIYRYVHPNCVRTLTYNKKPLTNDQVVRANLFIALFMITFLGGALLLSFDSMSISDALNYSQAMITNTGTSIGELNAPEYAEHFSAFSKSVMCLLMIAGRLEIYPFIMIFLRNFWRSDAPV